ncbi:MAG: hypothetical protein RMY36_021995 [Nostoc sp. SerVER01]|nr:hypothetical protein [Nostoc sp. SerVER01]MDZ8083096.1 hypothetical protein [Nostoc sp. DcaGUA01]
MSYIIDTYVKYENGNVYDKAYANAITEKLSKADLCNLNAINVQADAT